MRSPTSLGRNKNHLLNQLYLYNERFDHEHITNQTCVFGAVVIFHHNYKSFQRQFPSVTDIFHSSSPNPTLSQPHNELFPKRLHNVIPIIRELIQNYHAINFHSLLCQISPRQTRYVGKDSFHVLFVHELSVFHYIRRVLDQLLTKNMISKRNRKVLYHFIYMFICYSMKNTLTISNVFFFKILLISKIMRGIAVYDFTWLKNDHHQTHNKKKHDCISPPKDENNRPCASSRSKAPNRTSGEFSLLCNERHRRMALDSIILHFRLISWQIPFISLPSINIKGEQSIYWSNHGYNSFIRLLRTIIAMVCSNLLQRRILCSQFLHSFISSPIIPFVL